MDKPTQEPERSSTPNPEPGPSGAQAESAPGAAGVADAESRAPRDPGRRRFRPVHGILAVVVFASLFIVADYALEGGLERGYERVRPDERGEVRLDVGDLEPGEVDFYRFLNAGNQEVKFFLGRDSGGTIQAGFDANQICYKRKRGYKHQDDWLVCRVCDKAFPLAETNAGGGGCRPVPLEHRVVGDQVVLAEQSILQGWRYFR